MFNLKIKNLEFSYNKNSKNKIKVLEDINLELFPGDFLGLIGKNGSGKTTLIKLISGLLKPTNGSILINEEEVSKFLKREKNNRFKISVTFQFPEDQIFMETVYKDIAFGLYNMNIEEIEIKKRVFEALDFVGLDENICSKSVTDLSFGEKRKVAIAGVIALKPKVLVLDEPSAGLDAVSKEKILKNIKTYCKNSNAIIVLVSHSIEDILKYTNKIFLLENGRKKFFGPAKRFCNFYDIEKIEYMIPSYSRVMLKLKKKGLEIDEKNILNLDDAAEEILRFFSK